MQENKAKYVTIHALAITLVCVSTMVIQIPIPLGYMHLGNACILLMAAMLGPSAGMMAGGIGSALADLLTGYTQWVLPTLLIKGLMGLAIGLLANGSRERSFHMRSPRMLLASVAGIAIMVFGYFIAGSILNGSVYTGLLQVPGLTLEGVLGIVIFYAAGFALEKTKAVRLIGLNR